MKRLTIIMFIFSLITLLSAQNAWINEVHYDNYGGDVDEFIEVVIENAGSYSLADFTISLYNGNGGVVYDSATLNNFTAGTTSGDFSFYYLTYPANGIQNGPDAIALSYQGSIVGTQFLS